MLALGACGTRADLARKLGVSRARVSQVLGLLTLAPEVVQALAVLGDPLPAPIITERQLRPLWNRPTDEQWQAAIAVTAGTTSQPGESGQP